MDVSINRFQMGLDLEQLPPASAGIPRDGKQLGKDATTSIIKVSRGVGGMSGTPFEAGISSELGDTSGDCIASFKPQRGSDNPFRESVQSYRGTGWVKMRSGVTRLLPFRESVQSYRGTGWVKMRAGVTRLLLTRRLARATAQLLKQVQELRQERNNPELGGESVRCSEIKQSAQSEPTPARPAAHTVSGEELLHLAADMKRSSRASKTARARFSAFALSRQSLSSTRKRYSSDEDEPRKQKKGSIKFKITKGRGKSFTSIAKSMFATHKTNELTIVDVDVEPLQAMPEPREQWGCILAPPLPPSERQLAAGTYSDNSERGSEDRPCLLEPQASLISHSSHGETLMTSWSSMDGNKEDSAQQLYNEMQAAYEQEQGHGGEQVEASGAAKECGEVLHTPPVDTAFNEAIDTKLHEGVFMQLESLLQATQHRDLSDWELDRLVAGVLCELSNVTSKVLPTCLPHCGHTATKVSQELRALETLLIQRATKSDGSSGRRAPAPVTTHVATHAQHADPSGPGSCLADYPLETFPIQARHAPRLAGSYNEDVDISFLTQPPTQNSRMQHHASGPPADEEPLPHPPFKLLTPAQWSQQSWKQKGCSSARLGRSLALLSHTISSGGGSVDARQRKCAGGPAATASQNSGSLDVVGTLVAVASAQELVPGILNGSCPASCIRHGSDGDLDSDVCKVVYNSALFHPSQKNSAGKGGACLTSPEGHVASKGAGRSGPTLDAVGATWESGELDPIDTLGAVSTQASSPLHVYTGAFTSTGDFVLDDDC